MQHEIVSSFADAGLPLCRTLTEMLDEHISHRTERRGCGYTQATRFLATAINQPRSPVLAGDLAMFTDWPQNATEALARQLVGAGWARGWRGLDQAPRAVMDSLPASDLLASLQTLPSRVRAVREKVTFVESKLFMGLLEDVLSGQGRAAPEVAGMPDKPEIGSCTQAEEFFLEIAHHRVRRGGNVNIVVDGKGQPVMVEKMRLGESHSAMVVSPVRICEVWIPPGSLCALKYPEGWATGRATRHGRVIPLAGIEQARFLRLTTLAVAPQLRQRAFSQQFKAQLHVNMLSPQDTTIEQLHQFAFDELSGVK